MSDARRLPTLDGLRGLAALLVVLCHAGKVGLPQLIPVDAGSYGVLIFFLLSGFLMGHLYLRQPFEAGSAARYFSARVLRIVPLYYSVVIGAFVIFQFVDPSFYYKLSALELVRHLAFTGSHSVFWSMGPEFQFYFLFPLLWWAAARARAGAPLPLAAVLAAAAVIFVFQPWFPGILALSKLHIFMAGIGLALLRHRIDTWFEASWLVLALQFVALGFLIVLLLPPGFSGSLIYSTQRDALMNVYYGDLQRVAMVALLVFALSFETPLTRPLFANRLARSLGTYSFSIYLLHLPVLWGLGRLGVFAATGPVLGWVVGLAAVYATGWLSFRLIERPAQQRGRTPLARWLEALFSRWSAGAGARRAV